MGSRENFSQWNVITSEIVKLDQTKVIWQLNVTDSEKLDILMSRAKCPISIEGSNGSKIKFQFFLQKEDTDEGNYPTFGLHVTQTDPPVGENQSPITVKIEQIDKNLDILDLVVPEKRLFAGANEECVNNGVITVDEDETFPISFRFAITLTKYECDDTEKCPEKPKSQKENEAKVAESSVTTDLKAIFAEEENLSDLKLESKDGVVLNAHRFILAGRSSTLKKLIFEEIKKPEFAGTIKVENTDAAPLKVVLHWMYTGELDKECADVMEHVVNAATFYQLSGLLKILDRELITVCTKDNMLQLFKTAEENVLPKAMKEISIFIQENIGTRAITRAIQPPSVEEDVL